MLVLEAVHRRFGRTVALDGLSFSVGRGEIVGFLGENGAGKTTTLRVLAGLCVPDAGRAVVAGVDVGAEPRRARASVGLLLEGAPLYPEMRVRDYLVYRAALKDLPRAARRARVDEVVARFALGEVAGRPCGALSRGFRQRVGLADALLARPPVLLLDEPTSGLDPNQVRELRAALVALAPEHTVLYATHALAEVEAVAQRLVVVARGKALAQGTAAELRAAAGGAASLEEAFARLTRPEEASR